MLKAILFYAASILLTAVFSYSLKAFMPDGWLMLSVKTMLIPCFTWTMMIILGSISLPATKRITFLQLTGFVCMLGSSVLVPCGIYNFIAKEPEIYFSVASVIACVLVMSLMFYFLLPGKGFKRNWWWAFNILILINMSLFYLAARN